MSAIKLFVPLVFASCKLSLVAQEVDLKTKLPFPRFTLCVTVRERLYVSVTQVFVCHAIIWLQKSRQFTAVKMRKIVKSN